MEEYSVDTNILNTLNNNGVCKTIAMKKYAIEKHIPILRDNTKSLLISMIRALKPKRILEIGTAIGYSATIMLENSQASLDTIEKNEKLAILAKENLTKLKFDKRANVIVGDAKEVLKTLKGKYDFIFLDGPKGQYINYLPYLMELLNKGGVLFADNVLHNKMVFSGKFIPHKTRAMIKNLEKFLIEISENTELSSQIINLEDGISISRKEK